MLRRRPLQSVLHRIPSGPIRQRIVDRMIYDPNADQEKYNLWIRAKAPHKIYSILFTPRSGSSWLTSVLTQSKAMGTPGEWFNPELMPSSTRTKGARNLDQFVEAISRHEIHGNIFGFEITHHQMNVVFGSANAFMERFAGASFFWLIRKDILAQGISLDKMARTGAAHAANNSAAELEKSDAAYDYDPSRIRKRIRLIRDAERDTERMIADFDLSPTRLSYEWITSSGAQRVVRRFADALDVSLPDTGELPPSSHRKIGTSKNDAFAEQFRDENQDFLNEIQAEREAMLALHE